MPSMRRLLLGLFTSLALAIAGLALPVTPVVTTPAYAQVSAEFQEALESYGHWTRSFLHDGLVWIPYGIDDRRIGVAYAPLSEVLADMSSAS